MYDQTEVAMLENKGPNLQMSSEPLLVVNPHFSPNPYPKTAHFSHAIRGTSCTLYSQLPGRGAGAAGTWGFQVWGVQHVSSQLVVSIVMGVPNHGWFIIWFVETPQLL